MPSVVVVDEPKLDVMSLRTMPSSLSTFTPFVPSPGYGPPVSSGISATHSAVVSLAAVSLAAAVFGLVSAAAVDVEVAGEPVDAVDAVDTDEPDDDAPSLRTARGEHQRTEPCATDGEQHAPTVHHRVQIVREPAIELPSCRAGDRVLLVRAGVVARHGVIEAPSTSARAGSSL